MTKPPSATTADTRFDHIQTFLDKTRGQLTIGEIPPIRRAGPRRRWQKGTGCVGMRRHGVRDRTAPASEYSARKGFKGKAEYSKRFLERSSIEMSGFDPHRYLPMTAAAVTK